LVGGPASSGVRLIIEQPSDEFSCKKGAGSRSETISLSVVCNVTLKDFTLADFTLGDLMLADFALPFGPDVEVGDT
jgi:hypothetical protein